MKQSYFLPFFLLIFCGLKAQNTTYQEVYSILQTNCASAYCHSNASQQAGLDLEGAGSTQAAREADVYNNLYKVSPQNATAVSKKNYLIYPGDPYRSFLFRKISYGFSDDNPLEASEGSHMPSVGAMSDYEKEVIRQWIVYGAYEDGDDIDLNVVNNYYTNGGVESVIAQPAPPAPGEGFQIHLGPFFIAPNDEVEFFTKYETLLDQTTEIYKFQTEMGSYSHHFIVYDFTGTSTQTAQVPYGLRDGANFDNKSFVLTEQYSNTLETPQGTAFKWAANTVLDLNSHYISYSDSLVTKCEVYLNVSTQANGTAVQEMKTQLIPNTSIYIPNNNQDVNFSLPFSLGTDMDIFVWGLVAHTHKYGRDFNIYRRNVNGSHGVQVYDAGCANGVPGCNVEEFDYKHLPFRFWLPLMPVNLQEGIIADATYRNDGPTPVQWGLTSDDEMMLFVVMYTLDTAGLNQGDTTNVGIINRNTEIGNIQIVPNPVEQNGKVLIDDLPEGNYTFEIFNSVGQKYFTVDFNHNKQSSIPFDATILTDGVYFYRVSQNQKSVSNGTFAVGKK